MMETFLLPLVAAALALGSGLVYSKEVNLTDHDRVELRQRADALRSENALGRTRSEGALEEIRGESRVKHVKAKKAKKHAKRHAKRGYAKGRA